MPLLDAPDITTDLDVLGLDLADFPDKVWVLSHRASNRFGCYCHDGIHGLAVFSKENAAFRFAEWIDLTGMTTEEVSFDEARGIAYSRPLPVVCMMLLDDMAAPKIHYVR